MKLRNLRRPPPAPAAAAVAGRRWPPAGAAGAGQPATGSWQPPLSILVCQWRPVALGSALPLAAPVI